MTGYTEEQVASDDGTTIGFRRMGAGPAVVVVHGGMQAAQNFMKLAAVLSQEFEVFVPDRRGRGLSGPYGDRSGVLREVEDVQAVIAASGASRIFGLSSGALVSLRTALHTAALTKVALYEPPLSVDGSAPIGWLPRFDREIAAGDTTAALITGLKGTRTAPVMGRVPRTALTPLLKLASRMQPTDGEIPIHELVPTLHHDMGIVAEMADTAGDYAALDADVLLLGGSKTTAYLKTGLAELERVLPRRRRVEFDGLGHSGPDDSGDPVRVGGELLRFYR